MDAERRVEVFFKAIVSISSLIALYWILGGDTKEALFWLVFAVYGELLSCLPREWFIREAG